MPVEAVAAGHVHAHLPEEQPAEVHEHEACKNAQKGRDEQGGEHQREPRPDDSLRTEGGQPGPYQAAHESVGRTYGQRPQPGSDLPHACSEQSSDHQMRGGVGRVDDPTDGLGDSHPHDERTDEVEQGGETDGETGLESPRVDDGGDGVAAVVEAVQKIEEESDSHHCDQ